MSDNAEYGLVTPPKILGTLIVGGTLYFHLPWYPNAFHRLMHRWFFGFTWRKGP